LADSNIEGLVFCGMVDDILHPYLHVINYACTMVITIIHTLKIKGAASFFCFDIRLPLCTSTEPAQAHDLIKTDMA
jgi:hypothetical protein